MQSQDPTTRTAGALNHPESAEWMAFLYAEVAPQRKRELETHLAQCPDCAARLKSWRVSMGALDSWKLAPRQAPGSTAPWREFWRPVLKWAAAAAVVLGFGFALGRQTSPTVSELGALKESVAQLAKTVERERGLTLSNSLDIATTAANAETMRLLSDYSRLQAGQRTADQQVVAVALKNFDSRLGKLRAELETVALNTEDGFEQTHQNLSRLVSYSLPTEKQN